MLGDMFQEIKELTVAKAALVDLSALGYRATLKKEVMLLRDLNAPKVYCLMSFCVLSVCFISRICSLQRSTKGLLKVY